MLTRGDDPPDPPVRASGPLGPVRDDPLGPQGRASGPLAWESGNSLESPVRASGPLDWGSGDDPRTRLVRASGPLGPVRDGP